MSEVIINFESLGLEGIVAVGSYLGDAAKRVGVKVEGDCLDPETEHECVMKVSKGRTLLSKPTQTEMEQLTATARRNGERLACQTVIEKPGEVTIMSVKKKKEEAKKKEDSSEGYKKEFEEMPLEEKIKSLVELEAIALGETFAYVLDSPYKAFGKVMDVMAGFGLNLERADKEAKRPAEHKKEKAKTNGTSKSKKTKRKPAAKKPASSKKTTTGKRKSTTKSSAKKTTKRTTRKATPKKTGKDK